MSMRVKPRRLYIALEGVDGIGKTTQMNAITEYLTNAGFPKENIIHVKEPWPDSPITKILRSEYLSGKRTATNEQIQMLMGCAREEMFNNYIDHLDDHIEGNAYIILSDRCVLSSFAYGGNADSADIAYYNYSILTNRQRMPDTIILYTGSEKVIADRIGSRSEHEIYETIDLLMNYQEEYINLANTANAHRLPSLGDSVWAMRMVSSIERIDVTPAAEDMDINLSIDFVTQRTINIIKETAKNHGIYLD